MHCQFTAHESYIYDLILSIANVSPSLIPFQNQSPLTQTTNRVSDASSHLILTLFIVCTLHSHPSPLFTLCLKLCLLNSVTLLLLLLFGRLLNHLANREREREEKALCFLHPFQPSIAYYAINKLLIQ